MKNLLVIFAKNPYTKKVKKRLAVTIGNDRAQQIYIKIINILMQNIESDHYKILLYVHGSIDFFKNYRKTIKIQEGKDLGEKMYLTFKNELTYYNKVIIIGSDLPDLQEKDILDAFKKLKNHDIVIGPTFDGGYYLIGMKTPIQLFENIEWSTEKVFDTTIRKINDLNLSIHLLKKKRDIDTIKDLQFYKNL